MWRARDEGRFAGDLAGAACAAVADRAAGTMEMIWRGSASLGGAGDVFTGALVQGSYAAPKGFDWPMGGSNVDGEPVRTDPQLDDNNGAAYVDGFVALARQLATYSQGENVIILMGSDYQYENAAVH